MINQYLIEGFAHSYRVLEPAAAPSDEIASHSTLRQRVGLRLISIGHQLNDSPVTDSEHPARIAA